MGAELRWGLRAAAPRSARLCRRAKEQVFRRHVAGEHRLLLISGRGEDIDPDLPQELADFQAGGGEPLRQCRRKRTVSGRIAVERLLAVPRRKRDEGRAVRCHAREAAGYASAASGGEPHFREKRIVAAGVHHDQAEGAYAVDRGDQPIEGDCLIGNVAIRREFGIDRDDVVDAIELKPVAGVIDDCPVGLDGDVGELVERSDEARSRQVGCLADLEAVIPEDRGDCVGVALRVGELAGRRISGIADHERNAPAHRSSRGGSDGGRGRRRRRRRIGEVSLELDDARLHLVARIAGGKKLRRHTEVGERLFDLALADEGGAAAVICRGILRVQANRARLVGDGLVMVLLAGVGDRAIVIGERQFGVERDRLRLVFDLAVEITLAAIGGAAVEVGERE